MGVSDQLNESSENYIKLDTLWKKKSRIRVLKVKSN